jgi:hypothetical protein
MIGFEIRCVAGIWYLTDLATGVTITHGTFEGVVDRCMDIQHGRYMRLRTLRVTLW